MHKEHVSEMECLKLEAIHSRFEGRWRVDKESGLSGFAASRCACVDMDAFRSGEGALLGRCTCMEPVYLNV